MSQAIRRLEQEIGAPLFERTNRSVSLTPAGAAFLESARKVLRLLTKVSGRPGVWRKALKAISPLTFINIAPYSALLRVRCDASRSRIPGGFLPRCRRPDSRTGQALEHGRADLGFMRPPGRDGAGLAIRVHSARAHRGGPACQAPTCRQQTISLAALQDDAFVSSPGIWAGFHDQLSSFCEAAGFVPRIAQQARQLKRWWPSWPAASARYALLPASLVRTDAKTWRSGQLKWMRRTHCGMWNY
ncbi:LysR family transcriptional regulator [Serratia ureilytica]